MSGFAAMCKGPAVSRAWNETDDCINLLDSIMNEEAWLDDDLQPAVCNPAYSAAMPAATGSVMLMQGSRRDHSAASLQSFTRSSSMNNNGHSPSSSSSDCVIEAMSSELCQQMCPALPSRTGAPWSLSAPQEPVLQLQMEQELHAALSCSPGGSLPLAPLAVSARAQRCNPAVASQSCTLPAASYSWPWHKQEPSLGATAAACSGASLSAPLPILRQTSAMLTRQRPAISTASAETPADVFECACSALEAQLGSTCSSCNCGPASSQADSPCSSSSGDRDLLMLQAMLISALNAPAAAAAAMTAAAAAGGHGSARTPAAHHSVNRRLQGSRVQKRSGAPSSSVAQLRQPAGRPLAGKGAGASLPCSPRHQLWRSSATEEELHALLVQLLRHKQQEQQQQRQLQRKQCRQPIMEMEDTLLASLLSL